MELHKQETTINVEIKKGEMADNYEIRNEKDNHSESIYMRINDNRRMVELS